MLRRLAIFTLRDWRMGSPVYIILAPVLHIIGKNSMNSLEMAFIYNTECVCEHVSFRVCFGEGIV